MVAFRTTTSRLELGGSTKRVTSALVRGHRGIVLHVRSAPVAAGLAAAIRTAVHKLDRTVPVFDVRTVRDEIDRTLLRERLVRTVTSMFGGLALLLAATGLYGTVSHGVVRRTREFGIRVAVGARPPRRPRRSG